jgi:hypothetical protein
MASLIETQWLNAVDPYASAAAGLPFGFDEFAERQKPANLQDQHVPVVLKAIIIPTKSKGKLNVRPKKSISGDIHSVLTLHMVANGDMLTSEPTCPSPFPPCQNSKTVAKNGFAAPASLTHCVQGGCKGGL